MSRVSSIRVYPFKSLPGVSKSSVKITDIGGLAADRRFALFDTDGDVVNGKRTKAVHGINAEIDLEAETIQLSTEETTTNRRFHFHDDRESLEQWFSDYFEMEIHIEQTTGGGFTDSSSGAGPTIISEATVEELASWFTSLTPAEILRRLRPNIVLTDVPPFWEDSLIDSEFTIGETTLRGVKPVPRCVVPTRDSRTGDQTAEFTSVFSEKREETLPEWSPADHFDHYYKVMIIATVEPTSYGSVIHRTDPVTAPNKRAPGSN